MEKNNLNDPHLLLNEIIEQVGVSGALAMLNKFATKKNDRILTVISNLANHNIPEEYLRGDVFVASRGNLDFSSADSLRAEYRLILRNLKEKLQENNWKTIYLVPTGHVTLSLQIKMAIYKVTRLNTVDLFYSDGEYFDVEMNLRSI